MNLNLTTGLTLLMLGLTTVAAVYRVSEAPKRMRLGLQWAKTTCLKNGGGWVKQDRDKP